MFLLYFLELDSDAVGRVVRAIDANVVANVVRGLDSDAINEVCY